MTCHRRRAAALVAVLCACDGAPGPAPTLTPWHTAAICQAQGEARDDLGAVGALVLRPQRPYAMLGERLCSATLVAATVVLTVGHCVDTREDAVLSFTVADQAWPDGDRSRPPVDPIEVVEVERGPAAAAAAAADVLALGRLQRPVAGVQPMPILSTPEDAAAYLVAGTAVVIAGYGRQTPPARPGWIEDDGIRRWAWSRLAAVYANCLQVGDYDQPQRCFGDSGGPTMVATPDRGLVVISVGSHRLGPEPCLSGTAEARLDVQADWLKATLARLVQTSQG